MTGLLETSSLFKVFECFSVFVALVIHRIGNRGSQVGGGGPGVGVGEFKYWIMIKNSKKMVKENKRF